MISAFLQSKGFIVSMSVTLIAWLVTPVLYIGLCACMLRQMRGETLTNGDVFCRKQLFLRAVGQALLILLLEILWMLPGVGVMILSAFAYLWTGAEWLYSFLTTAGTMLMLFLGVRAALGYSQARFVLADHPEAKVLQSIRRSRDMMHTRRLVLAMLYLSFLLLTLLQIMLESVLNEISPVLSIVAGLVMSLLLNLYMYMTFAGFYLRESEGRLPPEHRSTKQL